MTLDGPVQVKWVCTKSYHPGIDFSWFCWFLKFLLKVHRITLGLYFIYRNYKVWTKCYLDISALQDYKKKFNKFCKLRFFEILWWHNDNPDELAQWQHLMGRITSFFFQEDVYHFWECICFIVSSVTSVTLCLSVLWSLCALVFWI